MSNKYQLLSHTHRSFDFTEVADSQFVQALMDRLQYMRDLGYHTECLQDKGTIEYIYDQSVIPALDKAKYPDYVERKNSQLLAPCVVYILPPTCYHSSEDQYRIGEAYSDLALWAIDQGWQTGFCICFEKEPVEIHLRQQGKIGADMNFGSVPFLCIGHQIPGLPWNFQQRDINHEVASPTKSHQESYISLRVI